ncbi:MAG: group 1 truncated hemoglobin [Moraxellaceae bacterium]|nr:group 1 truncated hemoglobin [Moraxellaceae bacterium]
MSLHPAVRAANCNRLQSLLLVTCLLLPLPAAATLYDDLGGEKGVATIVSTLVSSAVADPVTRRSFEKFDRPRLEKLLAQQICQLADGGCRYEGDSMKDSHAGLDITEAEFYGLVAQLRAACDAAGVSLAAKNGLLQKLAPMKRDIVTK